MSYSDIDKKADDFLGKKAFNQDKTFTLKAKTSSGVSLKSETKLGKSTKLNAKFKQSGINFSKIDIVSDGKFVVEANLSRQVLETWTGSSFARNQILEKLVQAKSTV